MSAYTFPPLYAAFIWWFSTGAVLLLVGRFGRFGRLRIFCAAALLAASLYGLAATANDATVGAAYIAFTSTILLWGAQEIAFLAGWLTGPRPLPCPPAARGAGRLGFALQAILYHELALLSCGAAVLALTWHGVNPVGPATFAALWVLRQSAKINLFLGVPVTNDQLMPDAVRFLKTFFLCRPVGVFFPLSVTLATGALVIMVQRIVEVAATPTEVAALTLVSTLFALGIVEHWFMLLPMPALTLWGWGMRPGFTSEKSAMEKDPVVDTLSASPLHDETSQDPAASAVSRPCEQQVVALASVRGDPAPARPRHDCARQRLEDQFRQRYFDQHHAAEDLAKALKIGAEPSTVTVNGRSS